MPVTAANAHFPVKPGDPCQPAIDIVTVTPSDTDELANVARAFRVYTTAGDVAVVTRDGVARTVHNVQVGERIDGWIKQIKSTGTTAVGIEAFI